MIYYLLLPYYIQCFRAFHYADKTNDTYLIDIMMDFDNVMMRILEASSIPVYLGGYDTIVNIWDLCNDI